MSRAMTERREATVISSAAEARRLGRYALVGEIAEGGMGRIYLARQLGAAGFEKLMAVKVMHPHLAQQHPELAEMFMDEARIASGIGHPNVCGVYDYGEAHGIRYLVMEFLAGQPVLEIIRTIDSRPDLRAAPGYFPNVARVIAEACEGLHGAHVAVDDRGQSMNVIHRDVSPENVFVTYGGAVKIMDFGIARATGRRTETVAGTFKGKYAYASPEAFTGSELDTRADIWSVGIVLWEMLTGRACFQRPSEAATLAAIMKEPIPAPSEIRPDVPRDLDVVAMRALQRDPRRRYETAREMARDLNTYVVSMGVHVGTAELAEWLAQIFPTEMRRAVETDRAVRQLDPAVLQAPELSDGGTRRALVSKIVHRGHVVGGPHAPIDDADADEPTQMLSNPSNESAAEWLTPHPGRVSTGSGAAVWPEQQGPEAVWPEHEQAVGASGPHPEIYQPPTEPKVDKRKRALTLVLRIGIAVVALGGGIVIADMLTSEDSGPVSTELAPPPEATPQAGEEGAAAPPGDTSEQPPGEEAPTGALVAAGDDPGSEPAEPVEEPAPVEEPREREDPPAARPPRTPRTGSNPVRPREGQRTPRTPRTPRVTMMAASQEPGVVSVFAVGGWADIFEGGNRLGRTPAQLTLPAGRHVLSLRPPDAPAQRRVVQVPAGGQIRLRVDL